MPLNANEWNKSVNWTTNYGTIRQFPIKHKIQVINHLWYSLDLSMGNLFLFLKVKIQMKGCFFIRFRRSTKQWVDAGMSFIMNLSERVIMNTSVSINLNETYWWVQVEIKIWIMNMCVWAMVCVCVCVCVCFLT